MTKRRLNSRFGALILLLTAGPALAQAQVSVDDLPPPRPLLPVPTARQLEWQRDEMRMFLHFGVNTFTDREWGTGEELPGVFNPSDFDAGQWARTARETGFRALVLTAKHHDGFALWRSRYSDHSVASSPWRNGKGDVVGELAGAVSDQGLRLGLYLSPWDRHEPAYGDEEAYNAFYLGQLRELLTGYGDVSEVWFDGAKGENAKDMEYDFTAFWSLVRQLQPGAVMFSDAGPDVRWIGNELGFAGETNWSTYDRRKVGVGMSGISAYLNTGEAGTPDWVPGECDVSIRRGWFYHRDQEPKSVDELVEIYFKSVGRNCVLLLNVPPTPKGVLDERDVDRVHEFRSALDAIFSVNLADGAGAEASSVRGGSPAFATGRALDGSLDTYWATAELPATTEFDLGLEKTFNVVEIQEPVQLGQRVAAYRVEAFQNGEWKLVSEGTTIGYKKLDRLENMVSAPRVRLTIDQALATPLIAEFGLYLEPADARNR